MDLLGDLTLDDCNIDKVLFNKDEVVQFVGIDFRVDDNKGHIYIKCKVQSGEHKDKDYSIMIANSTHEVSKKQRAMFFYKSGFWTDDEIKSKNISLNRIVGCTFQAKASAVREKDGAKFQNMMNIRNLDPVAQPTTQQPQADEGIAAGAAIAQGTSF